MSSNIPEQQRVFVRQMDGTWLPAERGQTGEGWRESLGRAALVAAPLAGVGLLGALITLSNEAAGNRGFDDQVRDMTRQRGAGWRDTLKSAARVAAPVAGALLLATMLGQARGRAHDREFEELHRQKQLEHGFGDPYARSEAGDQYGLGLREDLAEAKKRVVANLPDARGAAGLFAAMAAAGLLSAAGLALASEYEDARADRTEMIGRLM